MSTAQTVKTVFGLFIAAVAVWALRPPPTKPGEQVMSTAMGVGDPDAAIKLEVAPGLYYMPGVIPQGIGEKLQGMRDVAVDFVKEFPDTSIVFRNVPSTDREWLVTAMLGDQAPDILMVNVEDVWTDIHKGWYLPLDDYLNQPSPFVPPGEPGSAKWWDQFKYQAISRGKAAPDNKMYCVSYDMVETGVFYNKTKFNELGIRPPATWKEFDEIQRKILDAGHIPFLIVIEAMSDWGVDLILDQLYADILPGIDLTQDPVREAYLQGYLDWDEVVVLQRHGFFTGRDPRYREIFRLLKDWRKYWNQDLSVRSMDRYRPFFRQEGLMLWDGSWFVHRMALDKGLSFDWDVFYLPPITTETSRFGPGPVHPMCVIGGSGQQFSITKRAWSDTGSPETSPRLQRAVQFLQFMCLPDNARRIINESLQFIPNIVGVEARPEMQPFVEILKGSYTTTKWAYTFDLEFNDILTRMLALYVNDGCTLDEFLATMDGTLDLACRRAVQRRKPDLAPLEKRYEELAPRRADMKELPDGPR